jgi:hypothetical protein
LLSSTSRRFVGELGASIQNGVRILGGQFTTSFFLGKETYAHMLGAPWFDLAAWAGFVVLLALLFLILRYGAVENRYLLFIGLGLLAMALVTPLAGFDRSHWDALWNAPGCGQRYYLPAMAMLLFGIASVAGRGAKRWQRGLGFGLLIFIAIAGARIDFKSSPFTDYHFRSYAKQYRALPPGAVITIPINPPTWEMKLHKPAK